MNNLGYDFDNTVWEMFAIIQWFSDTAKQNVAKFMLAYFFFFLIFLIPVNSKFSEVPLV